MTSEAPISYHFSKGDCVIKRNPNGRSRQGWILAQVQQVTAKGTRMPAYVIRWRTSERPERVLQHMLIDDPDKTPPSDPQLLDTPIPQKLLEGS
jgi:hypothetical protein